MGSRPQFALVTAGVLCGACADILDLHQGKGSALQCTSDAECAPSARCREAHCRPACMDTADCSPGAHCRDNACMGGDDACFEGDRRCSDRRAQSCDASSHWQDADLDCADYCEQGECVAALSCDELSECTQGASCCEARAIEGGNFELTYHSRAENAVDTSVARSVSPFTLDRYEVSLGRFRKFVASYSVSNLPKEGEGSVHGLPSSGWRAEWSDNRSYLPVSSESVIYGLRNCGSQGTAWDARDQDDLPVRCVNWYLAQAFCIWDRGRLPTEAEWVFAATAGVEERGYPWTTASGRAVISPELAVYWAADHTRDAPENVGSHAQGAGPFGQEDLAGNLTEWVADYYRESLPARCDDVSDNRDCIENEATCCRVRRGGSYLDDASHLMNTSRDWGDAVERSAATGFRCAHEPQ
jgi:sulfatase modifying factor 1